MEKDMIITLDDNTNYALMDSSVIEGKKYFLGILLDNKTKNPTTEYEIFEEEIENNETYMNILDDEILKQRVMIEFTNNYMKTIKEES